MAKLFPKISIITPSFNQVQYLERTICSVLDQDYPNIEYIVIDGGSTDGSVGIIQKYSNKLTYWVSEPDSGQANAINKGLQRATGDWVAWQNSDDIYYPGAFLQLAQMAAESPSADLIIGNINLIDKDDGLLRDIKYVRPTYGAMLAEGMVLANQAAFWRRGVQNIIGDIDETMDCAFDYEWFLRLLQEGRSALNVNATWGALRLHEDTKTSNRQAIFDSEFRKILGGRQLSSLSRRVYQFRRLVLTLGQGHVKYVLRGLINRAKLR